MRRLDPPKIAVRIVSKIDRVGLSDFRLTIEEDYLLGGSGIVFKGYYRNLQEAELARKHSRLGLSMEAPSAPICEESDKFSILIKDDGYWTLAPYLDKDLFEVNLKSDLPSGDSCDPFKFPDSYIRETYRRVYLRNVITYPITIYAVNPDKIETEFIQTILDRLRHSR